MTDATREAARIEDDLDRTRARLDATMNELQARLSPGQLLDEALAYAKHSGGGEFGRNLVDSIKANPLPVALVGVGLAWLMAGGQGPTGHFAGPTPGGPATTEPVMPADPFFDDVEDLDLEEQASLYDQAVGAAGEVRRGEDETYEAFEERAYAARGSALGLTRGVGETFADFRHRVDARFREAGERSRAAMRRVRERLRSTRNQARDQGRRALSFLQDQPLLLGALGVTAGSLIAALLPPTRTEDEWIGPMRDSVGRKAGEAGAEAIRRGERVVDKVAQAATAVAEREGLSAEEARRRARDLSAEAADAAGAIRRTVEATAAAAREAVDRELSTPEPDATPSAAHRQQGQG